MVRGGGDWRLVQRGASQPVTASVRDAKPEDWGPIWRFMQPIMVAGETFSWDQNISERDARDRWYDRLPGRTFVAVRDDGRIVGSAKSGPNHGGPAAHVATASFIVDPAHKRQGIGATLCAHVIATARSDGFRAMQFNAVVATNTPAVTLWRSQGFEILGTAPEAFLHPTLGYVGLHIMFRRL